MLRTFAWVAAAVMGLGAAGAGWQWHAAGPVLVELKASPTPLPVLRASQEDPSDALSLGRVASLAMEGGRMPGRLQFTTDASGQRVVLVTTVLRRLWIPPAFSERALDTLRKRPGVLGVYADPVISLRDDYDEEGKNCGARIEPREDEVQDRLFNGSGVTRATAGQDVLLAVVDNGLHDDTISAVRGLTVERGLSWPPQTRTRPLPTHGTWMALDATAIAPKATLADLRVSEALEFRIGDLTNTLPDFMAWIHTGVIDRQKYKGIVMLNAWTMETDNEGGNPDNFRDDPKHPVTEYYRQLVADLDVDVVFAAGNQGCWEEPATGAIFGAASLENVVTFAAVDFDKNLVEMSNTGPGRRTMSTMKPDLSSYTSFLRGGGGGYGLSGGTSSATAVGAGVVAALRSIDGFHTTQMAPEDLKQALIKAADRVVIKKGQHMTLTGLDYRLGHGVIKFPPMPPNPAPPVTP